MSIVSKSDILGVPGQLRIRGPVDQEQFAGFGVRTRSDGWIDVSGEVDFVSAPSFRTALSTAIPPSGICWINMAGLRFIDSAGIRALVGSARSTTSEVRLCSATATLRKCWGILQCRDSVPNVIFYEGGKRLHGSLDHPSS